MFSPKDKRRIVKSKAHSDPQTNSNIEEIEEINELTAPEDNDSDEIREMKRMSLYLMNEMADFHERIKKYSPPFQYHFEELMASTSVFIWRKPSSSWTYFCVRRLGGREYLVTQILYSFSAFCLLDRC